MEGEKQFTDILGKKVEKHMQESARDKAGRRIYHIPRKLEGISKEKQIEIAQKMTEKYRDKKDVGDPYIHCIRLIERCVEGTNADGEMWFTAPGKKEEDDTTVLIKRLKVLGYDLNKQERIDSVRRKMSSTSRKVNAFITDENKDRVNKGVKYGTAIGSILSDEENKNYNKIKREILRDFNCDTVADIPFVDRYAFLSLLSSREAFDMLGGDGSKLSSKSEEITKQMKDIAEVLGITNRQRLARKEADSSDTVEALALRFEETKKEFPDIEKKWYLEECELLLRSYQEGRINSNDVEFMSRGLKTSEVEKLLEANGINVQIDKNAGKILVEEV